MGQNYVSGSLAETIVLKSYLRGIGNIIVLRPTRCLFPEYAEMCIITWPEAASLFIAADPLHYAVFPPTYYSAYQRNSITNAELADFDVMPEFVKVGEKSI